MLLHPALIHPSHPGAYHVCLPLHFNMVSPAETTTFLQLVVAKLDSIPLNIFLPYIYIFIFPVHPCLLYITERRQDPLISFPSFSPNGLDLGLCFTQDVRNDRHFK